MAQLRHATADCHRQIESRLRIAERFGNLAQYRAHIEALAAFHATAEAAWAGFLLPALDDYPARCKASLLADDVKALGGSLRQGAPVPQFADLPSALGGFYVLEGASLGGSVLLPLAQRNLGFGPGHGASYLASYGEQLPSMWQRFGAQVNARLDAATDLALAVTAARSTFAALEGWLCGSLPP